MVGVFLVGSINKNYKKLSAMIPAFMLRETIWMFFWGIRSVIPEEMRNEAIDYGEWKNGYRNDLLHIGVPDSYVTHGTPDQLYRMLGMDAESIAKSILEKLQQED